MATKSSGRGVARRQARSDWKREWNEAIADGRVVRFDNGASFQSFKTPDAARRAVADAHRDGRVAEVVPSHLAQRDNPLQFGTPKDRKKVLMAVYKRLHTIGDGRIEDRKHIVWHGRLHKTYILEDLSDASLHALAVSIGVLHESRENPSTAGKIMLVVGLGVAGFAAYELLKPSTATAGPQPASNTPPAVPAAHTSVITAPPPGSPPDALPVVHNESPTTPAPEPPVAPPTPPHAPPPEPVPAQGTDAHSRLITRLQESDSARQTFVLQALCYEWLMMGDLPDGLYGPRTAGMVREIDLQSGNTTSPSGVFRGSRTISQLVDIIRRANGGSLPSPRLIPFTLPRSVISQVNATGNRIGSPILLQIHAS